MAIQVASVAVDYDDDYDDFQDFLALQEPAATDHFNTIPECEDDEFLYNRLASSVVVALDDLVGDGIAGHADERVYGTTKGDRDISKLTTSERQSVLTPEILSRTWNIGLGTAKRTLQATTQAGIRNVLMSGEHKLRQRTNHLRFPTLSGNYYSDTMFATSRTLLMYTNGQVLH